ncbi:MAG: hypothetical protein KOO63_08255 [Bacteroidales bacterium]|nr:hypothetical protein [Candidatus Latescibacterota bacterium]
MSAEEQALREELALIEELQDIEKQENKRLTATDLAQSFNKGMVDLINLPSEIINMPLRAVGAPEIPTQGFRQMVADTEMTAQPGEEAEGFLPRGAEILGASVLPGMGIMQKGAQVLKAGIPAAQRTVTQQLTATTAQTPLKSAAVDVSSSFGAGFGGEVASKFTDDPSLIVLGELAGGFTLPTITAVTRVAGKPIVDKLKETIVPFTKAGAEPRAARRLQDLVPDPEAAAARIDPDSPISPARQTGDDRLIALERTVLESNPELQARFTDELNGALDAARKQAVDFGGDNRMRSILESGQDHLTNLVNLRAATAAQSARSQIDALGGSATPREISRIARKELNAALKDVRKQESELWNSIDKQAAATFQNTKAALRTIKDETGELVPSRVPAWINKAASTDKAVTFNDLQQVRTRVLANAREATANNRFDRARVLNNIADGLLDDMSAVKDPAVDAAREFSRQLNQKFNEGAVGALLSRGANRGAGVASADTLNKLFSGATPATNVRAFIAASPESAPQLQQFLKTGFVKASTKGGAFSQKQAQAQIDKLESQGMFEIFPGLKKELGGARLVFSDADKLAQRAATVTERGGSRLLQDSNKSLAGVLLGAEPGQEMAVLLRAENPEALAKSLLRRMGGDKRAINGLKTSFVESLFNSATTTGKSGEIEISGQKLARLFNENLGVARSLGMDSAEITRMRAITKQMIQAQQKSGESVGAILEDKPAKLLTFIAQLAGAKAGQKVAGGGIGSSLVIAGKGSTAAREILQRLTTGEAQKLLIAAQSDPVLYKALLIRTSATQKDMFDATQVIESWLIGAGVQSGSEAMDDRFKTKQGSENAGATETLNLGTQ